MKSSKRNSILDAALVLAMEKGASHVTLDATAEKANVSKGGLLYHFPSKEALFKGLIKREIEAFENILTKYLAKDPQKNFARAYIRANFDKNVWRRSKSFLVVVSNDPELINPLRQSYKKWMKQLDDACGDVNKALLIRLSLDGLWTSVLFDIEVPSTTKQKLLQENLEKMLSQR